MQGRRLGDLTINRVLECHTPFDPLWFFPDCTLDHWHAHSDWLVPTKAFDPATNKIVFPIQSYVVKTTHHTILPTCVGNHKSLISLTRGTSKRTTPTLAFSCRPLVLNLKTSTLSCARTYTRITLVGTRN